MNKQSITKIMLTILVSMMGINAFAYDIAVENADGVTFYYNYINDGKELEVTFRNNQYNSYGGNVVIPEDVSYMNRTRKVTSIGDNAFSGCNDLTSVSIPNSVTCIGNNAFAFCNRLTVIDIPNSVISIGYYAFYKCSLLTSAIIPNSVMSISFGVFYECTSLVSVTIPNSLTSISNGFFEGCTSLTSVTIPNGVTSIGNSAFRGCSNLTSVTIPSSVTIIYNYAFSSSGLTYIVIPNRVDSIGSGAFSDCRNLASITIPNSVKSIGDHAFDNADIPTVISLIENPFIISSTTFSNNTFKNATLFVPVGTIDKYKATEGWKDFLFIKEGTGSNGGGETPETKKCTKPTISYQNGKLTFYCETEGATCQYTITDDDIKSGSANEIQLGVTYRISVYATKAGYDNSETATATLCWIDVEPKTEGIINTVANVRALPLLIHSNGSTLNVSGTDDGTPIIVYSINGTEAGSTISQNGVATIPTTLQSGSAVIVKIGDKSIKVVMK